MYLDKDHMRGPYRDVPVCCVRSVCGPNDVTSSLLSFKHVLTIDGC